MLAVAVTMKYQPGCNTTYCRQQFLSNVYSNIGTNHHNINIPITFTNGQTLNVELIFCSIGLGDTGETIYFSQNSRYIDYSCAQLSIEIHFEDLLFFLIIIDNLEFNEIYF